MNPGTRIDYKTFRKINPEAARQVVLEYRESNEGKVSDTARRFGINRSVVYDILRKQAEGDLRDRSKVPRHQSNRTSPQIEQQVVEAKKKTRLGPLRLSVHLRKYEAMQVPAATIRHILRHNRDKPADLGPVPRRKRDKRESVGKLVRGKMLECNIDTLRTTTARAFSSSCGRVVFNRPKVPVRYWTMSGSTDGLAGITYGRGVGSEHKSLPRTDLHDFRSSTWRDLRLT